MRSLFYKLWVFKIVLRIFAFLAKRKFFDSLTFSLTTIYANFNLLLNKQKETKSTEELGKMWVKLMPKDTPGIFRFISSDENAAHMQIHLKCPLRGTGNLEACEKLMNYDRQLMSKLGGKLIVKESQSNSVKLYCTIEIERKKITNTKPIPVPLISEKSV